ncbi:5'-nucleotidase C-terminal domain-containing protein [Cytobacillus massiliigabonensis]|uniref:5'-nucleotidase C-terminal domain-containing protein n=1 Tax=Cytobacillus massiliigabonensis TaxID=1871011 RepID=UPI000C82B9DF|nr:5'-nucleotidase C-terminal domain-containing protein [Cytobacillus massiliigabonensis]
MAYLPKSYRKFLATASAAALVVSLAAPAANAAETKQFSDVKGDFWAFKEIYSLVDSGVISGYEDGTFKPSTAIIRGQAANLLTKALKLPIPTDLKAFSDVSEKSSFAHGAAAAKQAGIFTGSNNKFGAADVLTREQMATVLVRAFDLKATDKEVTFTDADKISASHKENVTILAQNGITTGKEDGSFDPKASVNRATFATFLYRAIEKSNQEKPEDTYKLSLMHTNDTHAHLDTIAKRATAIKNVRAEKPNALLIDAGDVLTGTLYFNEFKGQADLAFMNYLKYDVMTFGNHEFDLGSSDDGHKALAEFIKGAKFPFVSANVDFSKDELFKDVYKGGTIADSPAEGTIFSGIVKEVNGEKVGIFGITTAETAEISSPGKVEFQNYLEKAKQTVQAFEDKGINKIIAVSHIGYDDNVAYDNDLELAAAVDGIDIIVGGHTHTQLDEPVVIEKDKSGKEKDPTVIVQAYQYSDFLGTLDVEFDKDGKVVGQAGELIKVADQAEDPEAAEMLKQYSSKVAVIKNQEVGAVAAVELPNPRQGSGSLESVRSNETALGNLITDGMLDKAKEFNPNTVIAMQNGGGIRAAIDAGPITLGEILTTLSFGNTLATVKLTGAEILETLEHSVKEAPKEHGRFLHVSGMKFTYDSSKPAGERIVTVEVAEKAGEFTPLDKEKEYVVATNGFTAKGQEGYEALGKAYKEGRVTDLGFADWENLRDYVIKLKTVEPKIEGRIIDLATKTGAPVIAE